MLRGLVALSFWRCLQCCWFGTRDEGGSCEHPAFIVQLYGTEAGGPPQYLKPRAPKREKLNVAVVMRRTPVEVL